MVACSWLECIDNTSYVFSKWDGSVAVAFKEKKVSQVHINLHIYQYVIYWFQFLKSHSEAQSERTEVTGNIENAFLILFFVKFQIQIVKNSDNWTTWKNFHTDEWRKMHSVVKDV